MSPLAAYTNRFHSGEVAALHDVLTEQYPRKKVPQTQAEYIETHEKKDTLSLLIILPGFLESVYAYAPTMVGLEGMCDVITVSYSGFASFEELCAGIGNLIRERNPQKIYFYATSLGGLLVQLLLLRLIEQKVISRDQIKGLVMSHTAHISGKILSQTSFRAVKNFGSIIHYMPKRTLPPIYRARTRLKKFTNGINPYAKVNATPDELLGYFFVYACDLFQATLPRTRLVHYTTLFQSVSHLDTHTKEQVDTLISDIPVLNIFSTGDTVMHHKKHNRAFSKTETQLSLDGTYGHRNPRYFQLAIIDAIISFMSLPLEKEFGQ